MKQTSKRKSIAGILGMLRTNRERVALEVDMKWSKANRDLLAKFLIEESIGLAKLAHFALDDRNYPK